MFKCVRAPSEEGRVCVWLRACERLHYTEAVLEEKDCACFVYVCGKRCVCVWGGGIEVCTVCYTTSAVVVFALQSCHSCLLTSSFLCLTVTDTLILTALVFSSESVHKLTPGSSFSVRFAVISIFW